MNRTCRVGVHGRNDVDFREPDYSIIRDAKIEAVKMMSHTREFTEYLAECFKYPYLNSAAFFILSSPDPTWDGFCWRHEDGRIYTITFAVRDMHRPFWIQARIAAPVQRATAPAAAPARSVAAPTSTEIIQLQQERAQLQTQLQQLQTQNSQLQGQLQQLQAQYSQLQAQAQQLHIQNMQLQSQLQQQAQAAAAVAANSGVVRPTSSGSLTPPSLSARLPVPPSVSSQTLAPPVSVSPPIQNITNTLTRNPAMPLASRPVTQIDRVIVHHTAVPPTVGAERIAAFLVSNRGRPGINYHYFITAEGAIQQTNEVTAVALQSEPQFNPVAIGVAFAGDFTNTTPSLAQIESGARLIAWLIRQYKLSPQAVFGHKELISTQSPGVQWDKGAMWGNQLRQRIQAYLA